MLLQSEPLFPDSFTFLRYYNTRVQTHQPFQNTHLPRTRGAGCFARRGASEGISPVVWTDVGGDGVGRDEGVTPTALVSGLLPVLRRQSKRKK